MRRLEVTGLVVAFVFVLIGVAWLSNSVETLDVKAKQLGAKEKPIYKAPLPDYTVPSLEENLTINLLLGIISTLFIFGVTIGVGKILVRRDKND
jgi:hypothetical protein